MSPGSPPSTPRSKFNPVTPSTCDSTPLVAPEGLTLSSICVPQSSMQWELPPAWNVEETFALRIGTKDLSRDAVEPTTPRRSPAQRARDASRSPPPAPKPNKSSLGKALKENDLVEVVDILAKNPKLANMPLWDGTRESPLERAIRLQCDEMIIQILKDNGAQLSNSENNNQNNMNNNNNTNNIRISSEKPTWTFLLKALNN